MSWATLRPQLKTLLDNTGLFQETSAFPKLEFNGYPAAYVVQSDNESDYNTTTENSRIYAFIMRMFYSTKSIGVATALQRLEVIVDSVIDAIDSDSFKAVTSRVIGINMPAKYQWINTYASPSLYGEVEGQELVMAELKVRIKVLFDIT